VSSDRQFDQLRWTAKQRPDEVAYIDVGSDTSMTFGEWDRRSNQLARSITRSGGTPGRRVALHIHSDSPLHWLVAYPGIHKAGAVAVPTNTRLTVPELTTVWGHAEPTIVITSPTLADDARAAAQAVGVDRVVVADSPEWDDYLDPDDSDIDPGTGSDDLADIMYTSGTTGLPKGIAVRHHSTQIVPNGEPDWSGAYWLHGSPMFTFAGIAFVYNPMKMGMHGLFLPRFDVDAWLDAVDKYRPTCAFLVPAMVQLLLNSERFATADLSSLELVSIGSAPLPPNLHLAIAELIPDAAVTNNYSMTEAGTSYTLLPKEELHRRPGSVGIPFGTEIRIADDEGEFLPAGEVGEVMIAVGDDHREYYKNPEATAATWSGGWLHSGDLGELDEDGYLYIRGRKKDMIIRGGNNIACTDVEDVLYAHDAVFEAAVVALPHDVLGEDVGAAVVLKPGAEADSPTLEAWCRERLADYKVPRTIWFLDELPRNPTGKVLKQEIQLPV
jgi:long-chain acyl-CoA synthetase